MVARLTMDNIVFFYALDTLPLFLAIAVYIPFWPGKHVQPRVETTLIEQK